MAVTEQPVDIVSTRTVYGTLGTFVLGDHTKRVNWINSFYVSPAPNLTYIGGNPDLYSPKPIFYWLRGGEGQQWNDTRSDWL